MDSRAATYTQAEPGREVEFTTVMIRDSIDVIRAVTGPDYETAGIPEERHQYLVRYDAKSVDCEITSVHGWGANYN